MNPLLVQSVGIRQQIAVALLTTLTLPALATGAFQERVLDPLALELHGFLDGRAGVRTQSDPYQDTATLAEPRLQIELSRFDAVGEWMLRTDFLYDFVAESHSIDLDSGEGWIDLREANLLTSPGGWFDAKIGRQIVTWGTGDLLFLNDLFPKDWQSFFLGRDTEYLKAPSDAFFVSFFPAFASIDVSYTPRFDPDRYVSGERLSYWNPMLGATAGQNAVADPILPDEWFRDDELALRLTRTMAATELALYGYTGFYKSPEGFDPESGRATFPRLNVYGASARRPLLAGLGNIELAYYDSRDDRAGDDPFNPNSEWRGLLGYERELIGDLMLGLQYYVEWLQDYDRYTASLPEGSQPRDEARHTLTLRLTYRLLNQNLIADCFVRYSLSDRDSYLRPVLTYKIDDHWQLTAGANLIFGADDYTFLGQFANNSNVYGAARYSF